MSSGTGFFGSPIYKKIMSKVYGMGAAVAIMGALFKIMHFPGAGVALTAGLGVEALIFFLSSFEPPHEMPDWSLVYPELVGLESTESSSYGPAASISSPAMSSIDMSIGHAPTAALNPAAMAQLESGISNFTQTIDQLANVDDIKNATSAYLASLTAVVGSVNSLAQVQEQTTQNIKQSSEALTESFVTAAKTVVDGGVKFADDLSKSGENVNQATRQSSEHLMGSFVAASQSVVDGGNKFANELAKLGENVNQTTQQSSQSLVGSFAAASKSVVDGGVKLSDALAQSGNNVIETTQTLKQSSDALSQSYIKASQYVAEGGVKVSETLSKSGENVSDAIQASGNQLINFYKTMEQSMTKQVQDLSVGATSYNQSIHNANSNLSAINSVYEMHLSSINAQVSEVNKLNQSLGELNVIYGNMLSVLNTNR
ncbi:MAG: gliding motility protein GldL [Marinilabiliaceae bacterium]|nr:gliding motility protein GldL [Marinilabiliaceae bacterium]